MYNMVSVTIFYSWEDLPEYLASFFLTQMTIAWKIIFTKTKGFKCAGKLLKAFRRSIFFLSHTNCQISRKSSKSYLPNISPLLAYSVTMYNMFLVSITWKLGRGKSYIRKERITDPFHIHKHQISVYSHGCEVWAQAWYLCFHS